MSKASDAWNSRPMTVTVKTYCEHCRELKDKVEKYDWSNYRFGNANRQIHMESCKPCFEAAVRKEQLAEPYSPEGY